MNTARAPFDGSIIFSAPATMWTEACPIGNGNLGGMVYGGIGKEIIKLNDDTLFSGEPHNHDRHLDFHGHETEIKSMLGSSRFNQAEQIIVQHCLNRPHECYQPLGELQIRYCAPVGEATNYRRELQLKDAICVVRYTTTMTSFRSETFASYPDNAIVSRLEFGKTDAVDIELALISPHPNVTIEEIIPSGMRLRGQAPAAAIGRTVEQIVRSGGQARYPELFEPDGSPRPNAKQLHYIAGQGMRFSACILITECDGKVSFENDRVFVVGATALTLLVTTATSFNGFDASPSNNEIDEGAIAFHRGKAASCHSFGELRNRHVEDYTSLFGRVSLQLGNANPEQESLPTRWRIENNSLESDHSLVTLFYQFGRYLMISSSRDGTQPINLQGIWSDDRLPPWNSGLHLNINLQMSYWLAEAANLAECHKPIVSFIEELAKNGSVVAKRMYDRPGWVCHHTSTIWRECQPSDGSTAWAFWPMAAGWLCQHLWTIWEYSLDVAFLKRAYPILRDASKFLIAWLEDDDDGRLRTLAGTSPENCFKFPESEGRTAVSSVSPGPTMDMAIVRECLENTAHASEVLHIECETASRARELIPRLQPYQIGARGELLEWFRDFEETEPSHRHVSHLYGVFPGEQITVEKTPDLAIASRRSLDLRGDQTTGWATAWRLNLWARLQDGERAFSILKLLLSPQLSYPNLFSAHPPFQIDGNLGGAAGISEMLLQSINGRIHILPALPSAWPDGHFEGLMAKGGFRINAYWSGGKLSKLRVYSITGSLCFLRYRNWFEQFETEQNTEYHFSNFE